MPKDALPLKLETTKSYGGNVVFYDRYTEKRDEVAMKVKETLPKSKEESITLDYLFVCVGGGGLIAENSLVASAISPNTKIIGVEPEAGNDAQ
ncbi:hypothetical protein HJC23_004338 [Cyclotella cryptica]|uniref:Tryptophan synthase beta chain-like PALP domain-containing protein n=1 Tax=Cyclotella cryptica TaxID=29204 RepID=A0ABD3NJI7_9STRA